jgi:triosephosphate isomerase
MIPVICFGESEEDYKKGMSFQALESQIAPVVDFMKKINIAKKVIIAYEPEWAIGSDNSAPVEHLESVFVWLHNMVNVLASAGKCRLLYGGSVSSKNMGKLRFIEHLDGFLLGRASLDFQEFEKIVKYTI